jgi:hypothetical protein
VGLLAVSLACLGLSLPAHAINQDDLLPAEQAFAAKVERAGDQLKLTLDVAPAGDLVAVSEGPGVGLYHIVRTPTLGRSTVAVPRRLGLRTPEPEL